MVILENFFFWWSGMKLQHIKNFRDYVFKWKVQGPHHNIGIVRGLSIHYTENILPIIRDGVDVVIMSMRIDPPTLCSSGISNIYYLITKINIDYMVLIFTRRDKTYNTTIQFLLRLMMNTTNNNSVMNSELDIVGLTR